MTNQERAHYRVRYPPPQAPLFRCQIGIFPVENISEAGFAFVFRGTEDPPVAPPFQPGEVVEGRILFEDRGEEEVRGVLLRTRAGRASVLLDKDAWIPYPRVLSEQFHQRRLEGGEPVEPRE